MGFGGASIAGKTRVSQTMPSVSMIWKKPAPVKTIAHRNVAFPMVRWPRATNTRPQANVRASAM